MSDQPFYRLRSLPPYVLAEVDARKREALARGENVYDFGVGNPDRPSPPMAVSALTEAVVKPENHRYQPSHGIEPLRLALSDWYLRRYHVRLDSDGEVVATLGSKEGIAHLFWAVLAPGDVVLVPNPCYPIHRIGVEFAGGNVVDVAMAEGRDHLADYEAARKASPRPPRFAVMNFPHNPTTALVDGDFWKRAVAWATEHNLYILSDLAYADITFEGHAAPSALAAHPNAKDRVVEFFTVSKSYSMPGWRVGFCAGNARLVGALAQIKTYLDYGIFAPLQYAATAVLGPEGDTIARTASGTYKARRDALLQGLDSAGWNVRPPRGTMFVWAPLPDAASAMTSVQFAADLFAATRVVVSPGVGFGTAGDRHVRFALVEDVYRTREAAERISEFLRKR
jgi:alanine-synthesizing transaminase